MIEYLDTAIRATAGEDICICAEITDSENNPVTENCHIMLYDNLSLLATINGVFDGELWSFDIPANTTAGLKGRYWYCICADMESLCFKQPLYLI